jgi:uncharacterized protein (TIRG00374 family)
MTARRNHHERSFLRLIMALFILAAIVAFLVPHLRPLAADIPPAISAMRIGFLPLLIALQLGALICDGWLAMVLLTIAGAKLSVAENMKAALIGMLGNQIAPFLGSAAATFAFYRERGLAAGTIIFVAIAWSIIQWLVNFVALSLSALAIPRASLGSLTHHGVFFETTFAGLCTIALLLLYRRGRLLSTLAHRLAEILNAMTKRERFMAEAIDRLLDEFFLSLAMLWENRQRLPMLFLIGTLFLAAHVATIALAFAAFGTPVHPAIIIFGYTLFTFIGIILTFATSLPGVKEGTLGLIYLSLGVPLHAAILGSFLYHLIAYWLWLPFGTVILAHSGGRWIFRRGKASLPSR